MPYKVPIRAEELAESIRSLCRMVRKANQNSELTYEAAAQISEMTQRALVHLRQTLQQLEDDGTDPGVLAMMELLHEALEAVDELIGRTVISLSSAGSRLQ